MTSTLTPVLISALSIAALTACDADAAAPAASATTTAPPAATTTPPQSAYAALANDVRALGPLTAQLSDNDLRESADTLCGGLRQSLTPEALANPDNYSSDLAPYVPAIIALSAVHLCPDQIPNVDLGVLTQPAAATSSTPTPTPTPTKPAAPALPTSFGDGTYLVGTDVRAGTYRNGGDTYDGEAPCVAFTSTKPNDYATYVAGSTTTGPSIIIVNRGEYVNVTGCQTWRRLVGERGALRAGAGGVAVRRRSAGPRRPTRPSRRRRTGRRRGREGSGAW